MSKKHIIGVRAEELQMEAFRKRARDRRFKTLSAWARDLMLTDSREILAAILLKMQAPAASCPSLDKEEDKPCGS